MSLGASSSLEGITGWKIREKEATDDRCGRLPQNPWHNTDPEYYGDVIDLNIWSKPMNYPLNKLACDTTSFSVYHQISAIP